MTIVRSLQTRSGFLTETERKNAIKYFLSVWDTNPEQILELAGFPPDKNETAGKPKPDFSNLLKFSPLERLNCITYHIDCLDRNPNRLGALYGFIETQSIEESATEDKNQLQLQF